MSVLESHTTAAWQLVESPETDGLGMFRSLAGSLARSLDSLLHSRTAAVVGNVGFRRSEGWNLEPIVLCETIALKSVSEKNANKVDMHAV